VESAAACRFAVATHVQTAMPYELTERADPIYLPASGREWAPLVPGLEPSPGRGPRRRVNAIATAAAALALVAGTFAASHLVQPPSLAHVARQGPTVNATEALAPS
jgi:hypothetical protein